MGLQHMLREGVRYRQHIAVEMHAALGPSGGSRGERDQRHVVGGGVHRVEGLVGSAGDAQQQIVGRVTAVRRHPQPGDLRLDQVVDRADVAQGMGHPGDPAHGAEFVRPLLGEHRDGDRARLQHRQPAGGQPRGGRAAQQHPVARDDAQFTGEHMGDAVDPGAQLSVRPRGAGRGAERRALGAGVREEFDGAVQPVGVAQPGKLEAELGPLFGGREMVAREGVDVGRECRPRGARGIDGIHRVHRVHGGFAPLPGWASWWARTRSVSCW